jgi:hypothetical protein
MRLRKRIVLAGRIKRGSQPGHDAVEMLVVIESVFKRVACANLASLYKGRPSAATNPEDSVGMKIASPPIGSAELQSLHSYHEDSIRFSRRGSCGSVLRFAESTCASFAATTITDGSQLRFAMITASRATRRDDPSPYAASMWDTSTGFQFCPSAFGDTGCAANVAANRTREDAACLSGPRFIP